ncbi:MAG: molybdenum cofactor biosynthesis protein B [Nitrospinota bacterium]
MKTQMAELRVCVLTVSDRSSRGESEDVSGKLIQKRVTEQGWILDETVLVPDECEKITQVIMNWCNKGVPLILTTGGTGIGPRDVTPETVRLLIDKEIPGIGELMRLKGLEKTLFSALSRSMAGIRKDTVIITLPGSPKGATESLDVVIPLIPHAISMLKGGSH